MTADDRAQLKRRQINATVLPMKTREQAFEALESGAADAVASDRLLLLGSGPAALQSGARVVVGMMARTGRLLTLSGPRWLSGGAWWLKR